MTGRGRAPKGPQTDPQPGGSGENNENQGEGDKKKKKRNPYYYGNYGNKSNKTPTTTVTSFPLPNMPENEEDVPEKLPIDNFGTEKYPFLKMYFPEIELKEDGNSLLFSFIEAFEDFFARHIQNYEETMDEMIENRSFEVDYKDLLQDRAFLQQFTDFPTQLKTFPEKFLGACGMGMHQVLRTFPEKCPAVDIEPYQPHLLNYTPVITVGEAVSHHNVTNLLSIRGTVMRLCDVNYRYLWLAYSCKECGAQQLVHQLDAKKRLPTRCKAKGCRNTNKAKFDIEMQSPYCVVEPYQEAQLQKSIHEQSGGNQMQFLNIILKYDLVDKLKPGDDIVVTGIYQVKIDGESEKQFIDAVSFSYISTEYSAMKLQEKDLQEIENIKSSNPFRLLVNSLAPAIRGLEMVKAGLVLSLFSGIPSSGVDPENYAGRENVHILMVGDPGMGKSELLNACCAAAPKAIYSVSSHLTKAGLIGSVQKTKGVVSIDGGSLVLAHGGICCIDEMDKQTKMHSDLLDGMERQKINIAQNGISVTLACRTTIIAAANPANNIYNKAKTVVENIKINPALLTRFDLIFIITKTENMFQEDSYFQPRPKTIELDPSASALFGEKIFTLENFLREDDTIDRLSPQQIQHYINYARSHVFPKITPEAMARLIEFYMELRQKQATLEFFEITSRQFHGLRRLAVARARIDLADSVTLEHVNDVIELTRYCMIDIFTTEDGRLESRGVQGSGMSKGKQKTALLKEMKKIRERCGQNTFDMEQLKKIKENLKLTEDIYDLVDSLNIQGQLLMPKQNVYKLL